MFLLVAYCQPYHLEEVAHFVCSVFIPPKPSVAGANRAHYAASCAGEPFSAVLPQGPPSACRRRLRLDRIFPPLRRQVLLTQGGNFGVGTNLWGTGTSSFKNGHVCPPTLVAAVPHGIHIQSRVNPTHMTDVTNYVYHKQGQSTDSMSLQ